MIGLSCHPWTASSSSSWSQIGPKYQLHIYILAVVPFAFAVLRSVVNPCVLLLTCERVLTVYTTFLHLCYFIDIVNLLNTYLLK